MNTNTNTASQTVDERCALMAEQGRRLACHAHAYKLSTFRESVASLANRIIALRTAEAAQAADSLAAWRQDCIAFLGQHRAAEIRGWLNAHLIVTLERAGPQGMALATRGEALLHTLAQAAGGVL